MQTVSGMGEKVVAHRDRQRGEKLKVETAKKIRASEVLIANTYNTDRGTYRISILQHKNGDLLFMKTKDGELCELTNLSRRAAQHE